ncbi:MAG: hypothetical protein CL477_15530 [Acidobacteria bacterium]|jgi:hypothetical protein|nr:hypothetical protein [Acidobacteriota bacterium]MDP7339828.1 hypothetical protein [Vicinamibacterales bacterium]MDP7478622.1 hypothetical protein [Vicinamibacterales bacterium]MDP7692346.1 hypothetical protein [Vicinamibacterales bacterium]HJN45565.1 hypothetical protein [Vicinamibacterales bacterium]|tara:strand:+ start:5437 stop:5892 length:456 start_codon:yes stop_codon:yes gene_type:complete
MPHGLPDALRASAVPRWSHRDPVEGGNPFPSSDARSEAWDTATDASRLALTQHDAELEATAQVTLDRAHYRAQLLDLAVARFDVWARRGLSALRTGEDGRDFDRWLADYVANWLAYVAETCPRVEVGTTLETRLTSRAEHWSGRARSLVAR